MTIFININVPSPPSPRPAQKKTLNFKVFNKTKSHPIFYNDFLFLNQNFNDSFE